MDHLAKHSETDFVTEDSIIDTYAQREKFLNSHQHIMDMNLFDFVTTYKICKTKLEKQSSKMVPRFCPTYSSNPNGKHFGSYCKYQLLTCLQPWKHSHRDAWGKLDESDEVFIYVWKDFLATSYAEAHVPHWDDKLKNLNDYTESNDDPIPNTDNQCEREEWMILSDLRQPFQSETSDMGNSMHYDWQTDRQNYTAHKKLYR